VVTGERLVVLLHRHPLVGSLRVVSTGGFEIGFQVTFDFASGTWQHPVETGIFRFLTNGTITYDVTYHGNGTPSTSKGFMHIVPCPVLAPALGGATDPNAAN
jgi:hypothetical protein